MTNRSPRLLRLTFLAVAFGLAWAIPAQAQGQHAGISANQAAAKPEARAPALPGSKTQRATPAPADRLASDMNPTEALFDGINRGDLGSVKDAINRGAELDGRNLLGLTPMELSVDLGHHDISFLLMSMRDSGGGNQRAPAAHAAPAKVAAKPAPAPKPVRAAVAPAYAAAKFSADGGAPAPDKGFLGFGSRR